MAIDNTKFNNLFITDLDDIFKLMNESNEIFLCDTVAISHLEHTYHHYNENILKEFSQHQALFLTETIINEMKMEEDTEKRYERFLSQFPVVVGISEEDFHSILSQAFQPSKHAFSKFKQSSITTFQTIHSLSSSLEIKQSTGDLLSEYHSFFHENRNKGEYSLLWLSFIISFINPTTNINFLGVDRDLFSIVHHCYFTHKSLVEQLRTARTNIEIMSIDTLLYGKTIKDSLSEDELKKLCNYYRNPQRKTLFKDKEQGITSKHVKEEFFDNNIFAYSIKNNHIDIIY